MILLKETLICSNKKKIALVLIDCLQFLRIRPVCLKLHAKAMFFLQSATNFQASHNANEVSILSGQCPDKLNPRHI